MTDAPVLDHGTPPGAAAGWDTAADRQEAARRLYRQSLAAGAPLKGADVGRPFGRSARWGTDRINEVRAESATPALTTPTATGSDAALLRLPIDRPADRQRRSSRISPPQRQRRATAPAAPAARAATRRPAAPAAPGPDGSRTATPPADRQAHHPHSSWERHAVTAGKAAVRIVAAALSYAHMQTVAHDAGETGWRALILPISVDGLAVLALANLRSHRRAGTRPNAWVWVALTLAIAASLAANVAAAEPTLTGRLVAAWPPVALFLAELIDKPDAAAAHHRSNPAVINPHPDRPRDVHALRQDLVTGATTSPGGLHDEPAHRTTPPPAGRATGADTSSRPHPAAHPHASSKGAPR